VRSPAAGMRTFYQKHIGDEAPEAIKRFNIDGQEEPEIYAEMRR
jgi:DNA primase